MGRSTRVRELGLSAHQVQLAEGVQVAHAIIVVTDGLDSLAPTTNPGARSVIDALTSYHVISDAPSAYLISDSAGIP